MYFIWIKIFSFFFFVIGGRNVSYVGVSGSSLKKWTACCECSDLHCWLCPSSNHIACILSVKIHIIVCIFYIYGIWYHNFTSAYTLKLRFTMELVYTIYIYIYIHIHTLFYWKVWLRISLPTSTFYWNFSFIIYLSCYIVKIFYISILC